MEIFQISDIVIKIYLAMKNQIFLFIAGSIAFLLLATLIAVLLLIRLFFCTLFRILLAALIAIWHKISKHHRREKRLRLRYEKKREQMQLM